MSALATTQFDICQATSNSPGKTFKDNPHALPIPKAKSSSDAFGWNAGPKEITYREIDDCMTGREVARETFIESQIRKRQLRDQTDALINRLANVDIDARTHRRDMFIVGLVSGQVETIPDYRNCNMLPSCQSKNVHEMLKSIQYLFDTTRRRGLRMLVVSGGWTPLPSYRATHKLHTRRMSKFASHPKLKELGIDIEFYNIENTIHRTDDGDPMLNMHSHVLFKCKRKLGSKRWNEFLEFARNFFAKGYVHDSRIEKPSELVKYVFKPQEYDQLTDQELGELFLQIAGGRPKIDPDTGEIETRIDATGDLVTVREKGLKFFHPLGSLRRFRQHLRENRQKLILVPTVDDRWIWRLTEKREAQERPTPSDGMPEENRVLAVTRPIPAFTRHLEPCAIVVDYDGHFEHMIEKNQLCSRVETARRTFNDRIERDRQVKDRLDELAEFRAGEAGSPMKHTTSTTVLETASGRGSIPPPGTPPHPPDHERWMQ